MIQIKYKFNTNQVKQHKQIKLMQYLSVSLVIFLMQACMTLKQPSSPLSPSHSSAESQHIPLNAIQPLVDETQTALKFSVFSQTSYTLSLWAEWLLPIKDNAFFYDSDFLAQHKFTPNSNCTTQGEVQLNITTSPENKNRVFVLFHAPVMEFIGYGVFNEHGNATCYVTKLPLYMSVGSGEYRENFYIDKPDVQINILQHLTTVHFEPNNKLLPGSILRIGRKSLPQPLLLKNNILPPFASDLFLPIEAPENNWNAIERFYPTILVNTASFNLALPPAEYILIAEHPTQICFIPLQIPSKPAPVSITPQYEKAQCISKNNFSQTSSSQIAKTYSKFYANAISLHPQLQQYLTRRMTEIVNVSATKNLQTLETWIGTQDPRKYIEFLINNTLPPHIHVVEENSNLVGYNPFLQFNILFKDNDSIIASIMSNGTEIDIAPRPQKENKLILSEQKNLEIMIKIPPYNPTRIVDFFVNNQLYKTLYIPDNRNIAETFFFIHSENFSQIPQDFLLTIAAWGDTPLPELLYNTAGILPLAITSSLCVDANSDGLCHAK